MLALLFAMLAMGVGTLVGQYPILAIFCMGIWAFGMGFGVAFSPAEVGVSYVGTVAFLAAIALPSHTPFVDAWLRPSIIAGGGLWGILLTWGLWPQNPYKDAQDKLSHLYRSLATFEEGLLESFEASKTSASDESVHLYRMNVQSAILESTDSLRFMRARRPTMGVVINRLIALLASGESLLSEITRFGELLDVKLGYLSKGSDDHRQGVESLKSIMQLHILLLKRIADAIESGEQNVAGAAGEKLALPSKNPWIGKNRSLKMALEALREELEAATQNASCIRNPKELPPNQDKSAKTVAPRHIWPTLRANLTFQSAIFRHAVRIGLTSATAVAVYTQLDIDHGFWITLSVITVVKPDLGGTIDTAWISVVGTVVGCSLAAVLIVSIPSVPGMLVTIFIFSFLMSTLAFYSALLFAASASPIFVLLSSIAHVGDWHLAATRIQNTLIGVSIGVIGGYLLWPNSEKTEWKRLIRDAIDDSLQLALAVIDDLIDPQKRDRERLRKLRDRVNLSSANAVATTQRLLNSSGRHSSESEHIIETVIYSEKIVDTAMVIEAQLDDGDEAERSLSKIRKEFKSVVGAIEKSMDRKKASKISNNLIEDVENTELPNRLIKSELSRMASAMVALQAVLERSFSKKGAL